MFNAAHGVELTQNEIGELAGFARGLWSQWETGLKPFVRISSLEQVAEMFRKAGMPYVTRIWLEHGVSKPGDPQMPELLAGPVTLEIRKMEGGGASLSRRQGRRPIFRSGKRKSKRTKKSKEAS